MVSSRALEVFFSLTVKKLSTEILQYIVEGCQMRSGGEPATQLTSVFR